MVVRSAVTVDEYWYPISGSQLFFVRTDTDPAGCTWNSLLRLKNGMTLNQSSSSPGIVARPVGTS